MPFTNGPADLDVSVMEESFTTKLPNAEDVETWRWYCVAPVELPQLSVSVVACKGAPFDGEESAGTEGGNT